MHRVQRRVLVAVLDTGLGVAGALVIHTCPQGRGSMEKFSLSFSLTIVSYHVHIPICSSFVILTCKYYPGIWEDHVFM